MPRSLHVYGGPPGPEPTTNCERSELPWKVNVDFLSLSIYILENATALGERTRVLHRRFYISGSTLFCYFVFISFN